MHKLLAQVQRLPQIASTADVILKGNNLSNGWYISLQITQGLQQQTGLCILRMKSGLQTLLACLILNRKREGRNDEGQDKKLSSRRAACRDCPSISSRLRGHAEVQDHLEQTV